MSRYVAMFRKIWCDAKFLTLSDDAKLIYFNVYTTPAGTPFGLFRAGILHLSEEMRWDAKRYREPFGELLGKGFIEFDETTLVIRIPGFLEDRHPPNPNVLKRWASAFSEIPNCRLKYLHHQQLKQLAERLGKGFPKAFAEAYGDGSPIQEQEQEQYIYRDFVSASSSPETAEKPPPDPPREPEPVDEDHGTVNGKRVRISSADVREAFDIWRELLDHRRAGLDTKRHKAIRNALAMGYSVTDLELAFRGCSRSSHHMGLNTRNRRYDDVTLILRNADNIDRFIGYASNPPRPYWGSDNPPPELARAADRFWQDATERAMVDARDRDGRNVVLHIEAAR